MNALEREMISVLKELKEEYGAIQLKAEFEAEASRLDELMRLKEVASAAGFPLILKIGGVEAITDMYNALLIGCAGIIAPMAESAFAVGKFLNSIKKFVPEDNREDVAFAINIETITAFNNLDQILALPDIKLLQAVTVGRGDFVESMGHPRASVDMDEMLQKTRITMEKAKSAGLEKNMGGSITVKSIPFLQDLVSSDLLDRYETRKVVFASSAVAKAEKGIPLSLKFELLWLQSKRRYYGRARDEDEARIKDLEKRFGI
jgi:2-keto-3-deoxy-L-rhamnonate aldolase RhmA